MASVLLGCSAPPKLTPEQRRQDIEYLAQWAANDSPFVQLNEKHKGTPSYQALKPQYLAFAEQAESNEDFFLVICGYFSVVGASGHAYVLAEDALEWSALGASLGKAGWGISPSRLRQSRYWARLAGPVSTRAHPPFPIVFREGRYFTGDDWPHDDTTVPAGAEIIRVNGMTCSSYLDFIKTRTFNELFGTPPDVKLPPEDRPKSITREDLLKDAWIRKIIDEL